ncbi:MFS transporter [Acetobacteraceae bacterium KSS8]|uniref:MFS transporter n=1 Tax=Endosaccharibacter trunci TaxID=2812733 RepID=A0ABT1WB73_9PROT|nr:MFS transporter [Acetobacteraceae bacterium KSS8]
MTAPRAPKTSPGSVVDRRSQKGLDWLNFFVANLQTAFGPFIAVYLTSAHWTQGQIGLVLTVGSVTAMASQVPAGAAVDMLRNKHAAASLAIIAIVLSCLLLAVFPDRLPVTAAEILHGFASCMLNPAIAAITLSVVAAGVAAQEAELRASTARAAAEAGLTAAVAMTEAGDPMMAASGMALSERPAAASPSSVPANIAIAQDVEARAAAEAAAPAHAALGERFGRNASFGSIGNAVAAGLMGGVGYLVSARATFFLGALLALPGLIALRMIARVPEPAAQAPKGAASDEMIAAKPKGGVRALLRDRRLAAFAVCVVLYHLGNGGMLTLAAGEVTRNAGHLAELVIAACILLPQILGAYLSPKIGRWAGIFGRRPVMMVAFAAVPLRGILLAVSPSPVLIVAVQMLDAVSSAAFGVMMPLVAADLSRGTGRFNLCMGLLGLAMGIGASFSTSLAGLVADRSLRAGFLVLAASGLLCVTAVAVLFRETAPGPLQPVWRSLRKGGRIG